MIKTTEIRDSAKLGCYLAWMHYNILLNWEDPIDAARFNKGVFAFESGGTIEDLREFSMEYRDFFESRYLSAWRREINELFDSYASMPDEIVDCYLRTGLLLVYQEESRRLLSRVGPDECANILGWDLQTFYDEISDPSTLYFNPVQKISSAPLWIVAQAEEYKQNIMYPEYPEHQKNIDFSSVFEAEWEIRLSQINDSSVRDAYFNTYVFHYLTDILAKSHTWSMETKLKVANFHISTSKFVPETHHYLGGVYLQNGDWNNAKVHLEEAIQLFEDEQLPPGQKHFDLVYVFTLAQLAYVYLQLGFEVSLSAQQIEKLKDNSKLESNTGFDSELTEVYEIFSKGPEAFIDWFTLYSDEFMYFV